MTRVYGGLFFLFLTATTVLAFRQDINCLMTGAAAFLAGLGWLDEPDMAH